MTAIRDPLNELGDKKNRQMYGSDRTKRSQSTVKLTPRFAQKHKPVRNGDLAKKILAENFSPERSASVKRLEERFLRLILG